MRRLPSLRGERADVRVVVAHHELVERVAHGEPVALGGDHVEGQYAMRQVGRMRERHHRAAGQVGEAEALVLACEGNVARADHHPVHLVREAVEIGGFHEAQLHTRVGMACADGEAREFGDGAFEDAVRQRGALLDLCRLARVGGEADGADRLGGALAEGNEHRAVGGAVERVGLAPQAGDVGKVAAIGRGPDSACGAQIGIGLGVAHCELKLVTRHGYNLYDVEDSGGNERAAALLRRVAGNSHTPCRYTSR